MTMFTGTEGQQIPLSEAITMCGNYRSAHPNSIKALFYGSDILNDILAQEDAVGIRMYFATDEDGAKQLVLVGVDIDGNDLYNGIVADRGQPCPNFCDSGSSPLNK